MSNWTVERAPCHCGERFATYEAHMAHADYSDGPRPICSDPRTIPTIRFDGAEWTHLAAPAPVQEPVQKAGGPSVRTAPTKTRTCRDCGTIIPPTGKRGRPPVRCYECKGKQ